MSGDAVDRLRKRAQNEQTAIALSDMLRAVTAERDQLRTQLDRAQTGLNDPLTVFVNMKRGVIAKPSLRNLLDLYGEVPNGEEAQLLEIAKLRADIEELEALRKDAERWRFFGPGLAGQLGTPLQEIEETIDAAMAAKEGV